MALKQVKPIQCIYRYICLGNVPSETGQLLDVTACAYQRVGTENACSTEYVIPIKNCGAYAVHCLGPTGHPYERYCMGKYIDLV